MLRSLPRGNYRVWDIEKRRVTTVRHIRINERVFPAKEGNHSGAKEVCEAMEQWCKPIASDRHVDFLNEDSGSDRDKNEGEGNSGLSPLLSDSESLLSIDPTSQLTYYPPNPDSSQETGNGSANQELSGSRDVPAQEDDRDGSKRRYPERPVVRFEANMMGFEESTAPQTKAEAYDMPGGYLWQQAVRNEVSTLKQRETWVPERVPPGMKVLDSKFVFLLKRKADGMVDKYKARQVVKGFQEGHVADVYAPVVDFYAIRTLLACLRPGAIVHHLDVKYAFLNGVLAKEDVVYVRSPDGLDLGLNKGEVMRLLKALYGWKRAPKIWRQTFREAVKDL